MKRLTLIFAALIAMVTFFSNTQPAHAAYDQNKPIDMLVVIDTDSIRDDFQGKTPSQDSTKPSPISHASQHMIATNDAAISGQGTADLEIQGVSGEGVRFYSTSASANSQDAVIVYGILQDGTTYCGTTKPTDSAFDFPFITRYFSLEKAAQPSSQPPLYDGLPPNYDTQSFQYLESNLNKSTDGKAQLYCIEFAVFERDGQSGQTSLFGYFYWDPTIIVS